MGTTKLTRKEILSDDPVRESIVRLVGLFQANRKKIGIVVIAAAALLFAFLAWSRYLDSRADAAGAILGKGMAFFVGSVSPDAEEDPFAKGGEVPLFISDEAKYQAAAAEFSAAADIFGAGEAGKTARYFLGITQLRLEKKEEAEKNLESVAFGSGSRTVGFLAKKALADHYADSGNAKGAEDLLQGMIKDDECDLPKEDLGLQLSGILSAGGRKDDAIRVLRELNEAGPAFGAYNQRLLDEIEKLQKDVPSADAPYEEENADKPSPVNVE